MMYNAFKITALISVALHTALMFLSVTDFFNRIFIGISLLVLVMPRKWWALYILPMILIAASFVPGFYMLYLKFIAG